MDFFDDLFSFIKDDTKSSLKLNPIKTDEDKINESDPVSEICIENDDEEEEKVKLEPCIERARGKQKMDYLYQCDDCRYSSNKRSNMVSHMKSKHGTEMVKKTRRLLRKYVLNPESALDKFRIGRV